MGGRGVAVIGAGPAGLAAAWELAAAGSAVRVYEARSVPGGRMRTEPVDGFLADAVVQLVSDGYERTRAFLDALDLGHRLVAVPGRDAVWRGGRAHGLRYGSAMSMAASPALPTGLKLRLGLRYMPFLERHGEILDLNDPARAADAGLDDESIAAWGHRELGEDFVELMAYPLLAAYYGVTPEETSAALFHSLARAGLHVQLLGAVGGFGSLAGAMAAGLEALGVEFRYNSPVEGLDPGPSGAAVRVGGGAVEHDGVVVAVPPAHAARLLPGHPGLAAIRVRSTATLVLALDSPLDTGWFGLTIPRQESPGGVLAAVTVQSAKETGLGGPGEALALIPAPSVSGSWATGELDVVRAQALPALEEVLPGAASSVRGARLVRLPDQVFIPEPGAFHRSRWEGAGATPPVTVALAGDYLITPTLEGAVRSGVVAARRLLEGPVSR